MAGVTKSAPTHAPVTLGVGSDPALALVGQELTLAPGAAHAPVTLGPGSDPALALVGQQLTLADVLTPAEHLAIGDAAPHHAPVTIGADVEHSLLGQVLSGVDAAAAQKGHIQLAGELGGTAALPTITAIHSGSAHHTPVTLGGGSDPALALAGQQLTLADVLTPAEHTAIGDAAPHHAPVTLGGGSDPALALAGQQLTLADVLTPAEHTAIGDGAPHHAPVSIGADAEHSLVGQVLSGVDAAAAQKGHLQLAGQLGGAAASPDVRGLRETAGPTLLTLGAIADGEYLKRNGAVVEGAVGGGITGTFSIPFWLMGVMTAAPQIIQFADENVNNRVRIYIPVPLNWDGVSDITVKTLWSSNAIGLADLEDYQDYATEVDENAPVLLQNWTNCNLTWAVAARVKMITHTILAANIAASRHMRLYIRRNTGDANAGTVTLESVHVTTGLSF